MSHFLIRRLGLSVLVLLGVLVITYVVMQLAPVDPVKIYAGNKATPEQQEQVRTQLGLDKPLPVQIGIYIKNFFTGDWGQSLRTKNQVISDIKETLPYTLELVFLSVILTLLIGIPLGVISADKKDKLPDHAGRILSVGLISIPTFWLALVFQFVFCGVLHWFPLSGAFSTSVALTHPVHNITGLPFIDTLITGNFTAFFDHLHHLVLPVVAMAALAMGGIQRITRAVMVDTLTEEYVSAKRSYGLSERNILFRHALTNSLGPVVTSTAVYIAMEIVGTFVIESVFSWPGMGSYVALGITGMDYPVIMGVTLVSAIAFLILNTLADILLTIDPRVRIG